MAELDVSLDVKKILYKDMSAKIYVYKVLHPVQSHGTV